jgi:exodeoxyribonuclease-3
MHTERYTWWSYRAAARKRNIGWRIDYFCVSEGIKDRIAQADILDQIEGSDHCPVLLELAPIA